jgi:hypothetical protein
MKFAIDLSGPEGNAFWLIGFSKRLGQHLGRSREEMNDLTNEMLTGNYENLLQIFRREFGDYIELKGEQDVEAN